MGTKLYLAFGHKARQGKDTAAWAIHRAYPRLTRVIGFADALKAYCRIEYGMRAKDAPLLQRVGVELRADDPETWIRALADTAADVAEDIILVPDVRFQNEAAFVLGAGRGWLVRVERYNADGSRYVATDRPANHPSETDLDNFVPWDAAIKSRTATDTAERAVTLFEDLVLGLQVEDARFPAAA